jgi:hypothetical protein
MCDGDDGPIVPSIGAQDQRSPGTVGVVCLDDSAQLLELARHLTRIPEQRSAHLGSIGYGGTQEGDRILIAVDRNYDRDIVAAIATALRERGASVDVHVYDAGGDRRFTETDELDVALRYEPWAQRPRRWEGSPTIEALAEREGYDLLVHGRGGPTGQTPYRYEQVPWMVRDHFTPEVVGYPSEIIAAAAQLTWDAIWQRGRGARVQFTDLEGSDFGFTLDPTYWDGTHHGWIAEPKRWYGHLFGHPTPPLPHADAEGIVRGTTSHFSRAFPSLSLTLANGQVTAVEGGGAYGLAWAEKLEETRHTQYPGFSRPGLFNLWEAAIGGHPKVARPGAIEWWSSGGFEWERRRSGVVHLGFGTFWRGPDEAWAAERGVAYGHLHVHQLFPTYRLHTPDGSVVTLIENGRLTALDDPRVRAVAERYGDPDELLREDWIPPVPGLTQAGSYEDYARDPASFVYGPADAESLADRRQ